MPHVFQRSRTDQALPSGGLLHRQQAANFHAGMAWVLKPPGQHD